MLRVHPRLIRFTGQCSGYVSVQLSTHRPPPACTLKSHYRTLQFADGHAMTAHLILGMGSTGDNTLLCSEHEIMTITLNLE